MGTAVADDTLYWYRARTLDEARYLTALLNTSCLQHAYTSARESGRDFHLHPSSKVPIPRYDRTISLRREIAGLCSRAEKVAAQTVAAELEAVPGRGQVSLSKAVRNALANDGSDAQWTNAHVNCCRRKLQAPHSDGPRGRPGAGHIQDRQSANGCLPGRGSLY